MCDDLTRQEILFFTVIQANPDGVSEDGVFEGMAQLADEMGWPSYLNTVPRPLSERLEEARERSMIIRYKPLHWRPMSGVGAYVKHLANRYLEKTEQREKIVSMLNDELHPAE